VIIAVGEEGWRDAGKKMEEIKCDHGNKELKGRKKQCYVDHVLTPCSMTVENLTYEKTLCDST
jgi:hypothetical protein